MLVRRLILPLIAIASLAACATPPTAFKLTDARTENRFGDARTTVQGAEVILADDAISPSLVDRFTTALQDKYGDKLAGKEVRIDKAVAVLFVDDARVVPNTLLRPAGSLPVLRDVTLTALKHVSVDFAGTVDGKPFVGHGEDNYRLGDGAVELSRVISIAVAAAVNDVGAQLK